MEEANKFISGDEVISIDDKDDNVLISHHTYKAEEFLNRLGKHIDRQENYLQSKLENKEYFE